MKREKFASLLTEYGPLKRVYYPLNYHMPYVSYNFFVTNFAITIITVSRIFIFLYYFNVCYL